MIPDPEGAAGVTRVTPHQTHQAITLAPSTSDFMFWLELAQQIGPHICNPVKFVSQQKFLFRNLFLIIPAIHKYC